ncbi:hypothetical protein [Gallibacterium salpingitidis]|uniref:Uncharacterized protein n=1 Tax=Gallibacterium salpingitidis TaxID=505341 RepID=A0A1A7NRY4_9PAST|nr:hypothetical protein [Gallibacterium salpingitidis]OBW92987.1 hypothetical protein QS62_07925 [Gallibacterium salpingitidis]
MLVRNVEPRLLRVGGEFIAPNQTVELAENTVGLKSLLKRGVLIQVKVENDPKKDPKQEDKKQE